MDKKFLEKQKYSIYKLVIRKHLQPQRPDRSPGGGGIYIRRTEPKLLCQYACHQLLAGLALAKTHAGPCNPLDAI